MRAGTEVMHVELVAVEHHNFQPLFVVLCTMNDMPIVEPEEGVYSGIDQLFAQCILQ